MGKREMRIGGSWRQLIGNVQLICRPYYLFKCNGLLRQTIKGAIHNAHPAGPQLLNEPITVADNLRWYIAHDYTLVDGNKCRIIALSPISMRGFACHIRFIYCEYGSVRILSQSSIICW